MVKVTLFIIFAVVLCVALIRYVESTGFFHPTSEIPVTPADVGLNFEDIYFKTQDGLTLNAWFVKAPQARATLLFFHGNAGNISHRMEKIILFHQLGVNVFIIDYRGYGKSEGKPSEEGLYRDGAAAYEYLLTRPDVDAKKIIGYGDSLGGVVAVNVAAQKKLACLVVDSSFSSAADISRMIFPYIPTFILKTKMDSAVKVKTISCPKLFIHSVNDEIIPFELGKRLFEAACEPKEFLEITGGHNTNHIDSRHLLTEGLTKYFRKLDLLY